MADNLNSIANNSGKNYQYWNEQIKLKQESGLTRVGYCRKHGISCSQFSYWERKLTLAQVELSQLLPVKLNSGESISNPVSAKCTLRFKSGHELKVYDQSVLPLLVSLLS